MLRRSGVKRAVRSAAAAMPKQKPQKEKKRAREDAAAASAPAIAGAAEELGEACGAFQVDFFQTFCENSSKGTANGCNFQDIAKRYYDNIYVPCEDDRVALTTEFALGLKKELEELHVKLEELKE